MSEYEAFVTVKCRNGHQRDIGPEEGREPGFFPMCTVCYGPMFPTNAGRRKVRKS